MVRCPACGESGNYVWLGNGAMWTEAQGDIFRSVREDAVLFAPLSEAMARVAEENGTCDKCEYQGRASEFLKV